MPQYCLTDIKKLRRPMLMVGLLFIGFVIGRESKEPRVAGAQTRRSPARAAFLSGSERSEKVLREIASTLKRIEGRVDRIERSVTANVKNRLSSSSGELNHAVEDSLTKPKN